MTKQRLAEIYRAERIVRNHSLSIELRKEAWTIRTRLTSAELMIGQKCTDAKTDEFIGWLNVIRMDTFAWMLERFQAERGFFNTIEEYDDYVSSVVTALGITSDSTRDSAKLRLEMINKRSAADFADWYGVEVPKHFSVRIYITLNAIQWGLSSGRFSLAVEKLIDGLSGYDFARKVITLSLATETTTEANVVKYFNGGFFIGLPVKAIR